MKRGWTYGYQDKDMPTGKALTGGVKAGKKPLYLCGGKAQLTIREREFAEQNHNVIYDYLHKKRLSIDEYYDIAVFGYIKAVIAYSRRKELRKYAFTTIAWKKIAGEIQNEQKKREIRKAVLDTVSLDWEMQANGENLLRMIGVQEDMFGVVELLVDLQNYQSCTGATGI